LSGDEALDQDEPLPGPVPGADFERLSRRQSIIAWIAGWIVGLTLAIAVILWLVLR
jgi:hypothetical protein